MSQYDSQNQSVEIKVANRKAFAIIAAAIISGICLILSSITKQEQANNLANVRDKQEKDLATIKDKKIKKDYDVKPIIHDEKDQPIITVPLYEEPINPKGNNTEPQNNSRIPDEKDKEKSVPEPLPSNKPKESYPPTIINPKNVKLSYRNTSGIPLTLLLYDAQQIGNSIPYEPIRIDFPADSYDHLFENNGRIRSGKIYLEVQRRDNVKHHFINSMLPYKEINYISISGTGNPRTPFFMDANEPIFK